MWIWFALAIVALIVFAVSRSPRVRYRRTWGVPTYTVAEPSVLPGLSWPAGFEPQQRLRVVRRPDALYLITELPSRSAALEFLRGCEVRRERIYVIAENPDANLGKDLIMIFVESTGAFVEVAERSVLSHPTSSQTDCARCGYPIIPMDSPWEPGDRGEHGSRTWLLALEDMQMQGTGYRCESCGALSCARCYAASEKSKNADGSLNLSCWMRDCQREVAPFVA